MIFLAFKNCLRPIGAVAIPEDRPDLIHEIRFNCKLTNLIAEEITEKEFLRLSLVIELFDSFPQPILN